jgi:hypothetical protein
LNSEKILENMEEICEIWKKSKFKCEDMENAEEK